MKHMKQQVYFLQKTDMRYIKIHTMTEQAMIWFDLPQHAVKI